MFAFILRPVLWIVLLLLGAATAFAQDANAPGPLMGSEASPALVSPAAPDAAAGFGGEDGIYRILVVGDALAGGLGAGMTRMAQADPRFEIINRFNESSGLARVEVYDWPSALAKIVASKPVDAIVVLVGVNDRQDIRESNVRYPFKSEGWVKGYTANVDRLLTAARDANAKLFWISVPPMADPGFDADMRYVSDLHRQQVAAGKGHYVDVRPFFLAPDGSYVDKGPDETGVERKLRSRDGVSFFKQGNNRFGQLVLGAVKSLGAVEPAAPAAPAVAAATPTEPPKVLATPAPAQPQSVAIAPPSFGQDGLEGEQITFRADAVTLQKDVKKPIDTAVAVETAAPKMAAKPGSQAQRLLVQGLVGDAPAGRFDDFTVPATP